MVAGKAGRVAEIFLVVATEGALATGGVQPGSAHSIAWVKARDTLSDLIDDTEETNWASLTAEGTASCTDR